MTKFVAAVGTVALLALAPWANTTTNGVPEAVFLVVCDPSMNEPRVT